MAYIEKNVEDLVQGDMIHVQYGVSGNYTNLRIRNIKKLDDITYLANVFTPAGHPDGIQLDIAEIIQVKNKEEKKGNDIMPESRVMGVHKKLAEVQRKLVAPKNQFNKFGKYNYRSCEDILEGVKPLLSEVGATLTITDDIFPCEGRVYVKSTATFTDIETSDKVTNTAFAREEESKKGMDSSQVTGATSSYARKYALNGLFCIDDNKDPDTDEFKNQQQARQQGNPPQQNQQHNTSQNNNSSQQYQQAPPQQAPQKAQPQQTQPQQNQQPVQGNVYMVQTVRKLCQALNVQEAQVVGLVASKKLETMTTEEFNIIMKNFKATPGYSDNLLK